MTVGKLLSFLGHFVVLLASIALHAEAKAASDPWATYINARFAYSTCYPENIFAPQGEADNGDGQKFLASDGAEMLVWGWNNALDEMIDEVVQRRIKGKPTYQAGKQNWRVVSGNSDLKVFYYKVVQRKGQFLSLYILYDRSLAPIYDPIVARISTCFRSIP
jgi:hypothetical protein